MCHQKILNIVYCFNEIENKLLDFSTNFENVCIIGDWNARTCEEHDYILTNFDTFSDFLKLLFNLNHKMYLLSDSTILTKLLSSVL
jgi:hypothetical protein